MDMAICLVYFNPANSKRILMNLLFVKNTFECEVFPTFTLELVYKGDKPQIEGSYRVYAESYMFHKENLCRVLEKTIPEQYKKLAFIDADVCFSNRSWYTRASRLLDEFEIVQPFEKAVWMDLSYTKQLQARKCSASNKSDQMDFSLHPGFGYCVKRDWYNKNGFFDYGVTGSGDCLSILAWLNQRAPPDKVSTTPPPALLTEFSKYRQKINSSPPEITYLKGITVYHLYHGTNRNRQYQSRHSLLESEGNVMRLIYHNSDGVLEWIDKEKWNPLFRQYFIDRQDDYLPDK